jgi:hypothetical protein
MVAGGVGIAVDVLFTAFQAYMLAAKERGLTAEQAKAAFDANYDKFMAESAAPVDPVRET